MASSTAEGAAAAPSLSWQRRLDRGSPARQYLPAALAALTVLSQIGYPLTSGAARNRLTVLTVLLWCAASLTHAAATRGLRFAASLLAVSGGVGFGAEVLGVAVGQPFGSYGYAGTLGLRLAGVPVVVAMAWVMMAYPALLVGRRIGAPILGGTAALATWDLFLDPQMVAAGHWRFTGAGPTVNGIPVSNTIGWVAVSFLIMAILARLHQPPDSSARRPDDRLPLGLYLWTYGSSTLAAVAFFHQPGVALVGGLVMGLPVTLLVTSQRGRAGPGVTA